MKENSQIQGLNLVGVVVGQRVDSGEWEGKKYVNAVVLISDGARTYTVKNLLKEGEAAKPYELYKMVSVRVTYAATDKGNISVKGDIVAL